jgi:cyclopropane-fatty-acyl-phospholipid synthase
MIHGASPWPFIQTAGTIMDFILDLEKVESGEVDDRTLRGLIAYGCARDLAERDRASAEAQAERRREFVALLRRSPVAVETEAANRQHYEAPAAFFHTVLGRHLKYSCCWYGEDVADLDAAEEATLRLICRRAQVADGQDVLDLGCGWGALSLFLAEQFPRSRVTGLSNSHSQKAFIDRQARARGLTNLTIVTADIRQHEFPAVSFDRIVSIEMFEHMRNYERLLARVAGWMRPDARLFVHVFSHLRHAYLFENNWIADYFFTGGLMPSDSLLLYFQRHVEVQDHWFLDGTHYQKTADAWLAKMDANRERVLAIFADHYGADAGKMFAMWRLFFLTMAESFGFRRGQEWGVSHYLFGRR